jgi:two-component system, OmpR family, sensor kinase
MNQSNSDSAAGEREGFFRELEIEFLLHELKDPIAIIETGMRALLEKSDKYGALSARQEKTLRRTLRNTWKVRDMVNGLLEIGRSEAGRFVRRRFSPLPVVFAVTLEALEIMGKAVPDAGRMDEGGRDAGRAEPDMPAVCASQQVFVTAAPGMEHVEMLQDEVKFRQIVGNLLKNALFHRRDRIDVRLCAGHGALRVEITDDGPGIEPEHQQLIFQRYTQVAETPSPRKGHGLGLAGALILARSLGGDLGVSSVKGQGATFSLSLPLVLERATA